MSQKKAITIRDVLFLCHPKPKNEEQAQDWKDLAEKKLEPADTWETKLSSGQDKKEAFSELLSKGKMGKLAFLRNMKNMHDAGIDKNVLTFELLRNSKEMIPFQYLAAARECPQWEDIIDQAMINSSALKPKMFGKTIVLVDVSTSMEQTISFKSIMTRMDAACGMAILLRECIEDVTIMTFSNQFALVPNRHGMALRDAIVKSQPHRGTYLGNCLTNILKSGLYYDRLIVITDEQTGDNIPHMPMGKNYILNIAGYQNGIGYVNQWTTITGFSEASIDFIRELEEMQGLTLHTLYSKRFDH